MCGIVCYKGSLNAKDIILDGLEKLEYRGYDSSGLAIIKDSKLEIHKEKGPIASLKEEIGGKDYLLTSALAILDGQLMVKLAGKMPTHTHLPMARLL